MGWVRGVGLSNPEGRLLYGPYDYLSGGRKVRERLWLRWAPWLLLALRTASRRGFTDWEVPWPPSPHSGPAGGLDLVILGPNTWFDVWQIHLLQDVLALLEGG